MEAFDESLFLIDVEVSAGLTKTRSSGVFGLLPGAEVVLRTDSSPPRLCDVARRLFFAMLQRKLRSSSPLELSRT
jgi:hypothetical protein